MSIPDRPGPEFQFIPVSGQRVLVLGMGGGSDILFAYLLANHLRQGASCQVVDGNTKRNARDLIRVTDHVFRLPSAGAGQIDLARAHGTTAIDQLVPRGDQECPFIVVLPKCSYLEEQQSLESQVADEIRSMAFDLLVGVDIGGDSLVDAAVSGAEGRDRQMLHVLRGVGIPMLHVVVAPGSDGESTGEALAAARENDDRAGRYLGWFSLEPMATDLRSFARFLPPSRTPNIILGAFDGRLRADRDGQVVVHRGIRPVLPRGWLTTAWVFK